MNAIERRLAAAVNPVSTATTGWWCQSAMRHLFTVHGPSASQRRIRIRRQAARTATQRADGTAARSADRAAAQSAETMKARAAAIDELLASQITSRKPLHHR